MHTLISPDMKYKIRSFAILLIGLLTTLILQGQDPAKLRHEAPEAHGFSPERLERLAADLERALEHEKTPGAAVLIMRHGAIVYEKTFGYQDMVTSQPMNLRSIFRIYSMTKPITSVAIMMLWEQGLLQLNDPVSMHIPELAGMKVALENAEQTEIISLEDSRREITIQDLLRHTSGLTYGIFGRQTAVRKEYIKAGISPRLQSSEEFIENIAGLPLMDHPGDRWEYSYSTDVLGCLVERISGMTLGAYFKQYIFDPLNMDDTGFYIPEDKLQRAAQGYDYNTESYPAHLSNVAVEPKMHSGGGGLVSTLYDYALFSQMMLNGGEMNGVKLLSPKTVELMTSNHLEAKVDQGDLYLPGPGYGFGLGFAVRLETGVSYDAGTQGDYRWGGWAGTGFWIDPREELIAIFMIQDVASSGYLRSRFKNLVYQAIVE
jgi:CubicO group peptidase (beta-lactamase class C family)